MSSWYSGHNVWLALWNFFFFFQAEDGIRDWSVTGVQTCALPISWRFGPWEKVRERDVHGFRDFGERFKRRDRVPVFHARQVTTQQPGAALDVALRQAALAPVSPDRSEERRVGEWRTFGVVRCGCE